MNISVLTVFPELYTPFMSTSLLKRAQDVGRIATDVETFFSYVKPKERIDAPTFGHGAGMLLRPEVVKKAIEDKEKKHGKAFKIFFSPQGKKLDQNLLKQIALRAQETNHLMLVPSRYEGMDARVEERYADLVVSVGDFVLMGGDIPAMMLIEGALRLLPGIVGKEQSVQEESFSGPFVDYPEFTAPVEFDGLKVPDVVRSGDHKALDEWRRDQAAKKSVIHHFAWLRQSALTKEEKQRAQKYVPAHYVALMHTDVLVGEARQEGTTSVTSIDIHDIARSSCTYGVKNYFVVTPLHDQQRIVNTFLEFWCTGSGPSYNQQRFKAVKNVLLVHELKDVIREIKSKEGKDPLIIATSARKEGHDRTITYHDQELVWEHERPVLLVFGTGQGLSEAFLGTCDYLLVPVEGLSGFNHLSVRSAVGIVLDRWLGLNVKH